MTAPDLPPVTSPTAGVDVPGLLAQLASLKDDLEQLQREQREELDRFREETVAERAEHAQRARAGELGREWQTLQSRIDLGETSLEAVVRGEDDSPQAEVVRGFARDNVEQAAAELDAEVAAAEAGPVIGVEPSPAAVAALESRALAAEVRAQVERLQALQVPRP